MVLKRKQIIFPPFLLRAIFAYLPIVVEKQTSQFLWKKMGIFIGLTYCNCKTKILFFTTQKYTKCWCTINNLQGRSVCFSRRFSCAVHQVHIFFHPYKFLSLSQKHRVKSAFTKRTKDANALPCPGFAGWFLFVGVCAWVQASSLQCKFRQKQHLKWLHPGHLLRVASPAVHRWPWMFAGQPHFVEGLPDFSLLSQEADY